MSQKASRKAVATDEKEKRTDSPVKDMKKKMAANAEKEKQTAEKTAVVLVEKVAEKVEKPKEKTEKPTEKAEKPVEKSDKEKPADKKAEKSDKKTEPAAEKKEETNKEDKASKPEKEKPDPKKSKQNGNARVNGGTNGESHNGTVSGDEDEDSDEMFPELAYDSSDPEFEPDAPPRSFTRRSQAKAVRTPETPRPASDKQESTSDDSTKDSKVLKLKEDVPSTDRKLRSQDSPKPQEKKDNQEKEQEKAADKRQLEKTDTKEQEKTEESGKEKENAGEKAAVVEIVEIDEHEEESRKPDTNYSKSRVKVSPYRRSMRLADQTASSMAANYTGNNTTMEMDITETSIVSEDQSLNDSSYLSGLRTIRGRRSYKPLKEMTLRHVNTSVRSNASTAGVEQPARPTGTVVGRKRRPERSASVEYAAEAEEGLHTPPEDAAHSHGKRMRLLDRIFRRDHSADIVGINTDLPLTAPVAAEATELNKPVPLAHTDADRDSKRCAIM